MYLRGKFGIEYSPPKPQPETSWLARVLVVAALAAAVLAVKAVIGRMHGGDTEVEVVVAAPVSVTNDSAVASVEPTVVRQIDYSNRPVRVRNLLLRLEAAERRRDIEMTATTIEQLRATPGAADLDDSLARRLGALNLVRLFTLKSALWTTVVTVKRGDTASRIAFEHGSTYASLVKLNGTADNLRAGGKLTVMNHPRFNLEISRRTRTADLWLNGKFFKRYDLNGDVKGGDGSYHLDDRLRDFCQQHGVMFRPLDRAELEMLMPKGSAIFIKEL